MEREGIDELYKQLMEKREFDELYKHMKRGRIEAIREFLDSGGDVNARRGTGEGAWTLLMSAASLGKAKIVELLLERGADPYPSTVCDENALALAVGGGHVKCVELLLDKGAGADINPCGGTLSEYMSVTGGPYPNVQRLLDEYVKRHGETSPLTSEG